MRLSLVLMLLASTPVSYGGTVSFSTDNQVINGQMPNQVQAAPVVAAPVAPPASGTSLPAPQAPTQMMNANGGIVTPGQPTVYPGAIRQPGSQNGNGNAKTQPFQQLLQSLLGAGDKDSNRGDNV